MDLVQEWQRGNQPVFVFSSLLSQRQFTAAKIDIDMRVGAVADCGRSSLTVHGANDSDGCWQNRIVSSRRWANKSSTTKNFRALRVSTR